VLLKLLQESKNDKDNSKVHDHEIDETKLELTSVENKENLRQAMGKQVMVKLQTQQMELAIVKKDQRLAMIWLLQS
jgi:hypothetical protein